MTGLSGGATQCTRCTTRPATLLGVPIEAALDARPDGTPLRNEMMFPIEPDTWLRLCEPCVDALMGARALAGAFDLGTWQDPRSSVRRAPDEGPQLPGDRV
jgi:hypothetical protein